MIIFVLSTSSSSSMQEATGLGAEREKKYSNVTALRGILVPLSTNGTRRFWFR